MVWQLLQALSWLPSRQITPPWCMPLPPLLPPLSWPPALPLLPPPPHVLRDAPAARSAASSAFARHSCSTNSRSSGSAWYACAASASWLPQLLLLAYGMSTRSPPPLVLALALALPPKVCTCATASSMARSRRPSLLSCGHHALMSSAASAQSNASTSSCKEHACVCTHVCAV